MRTIYIFSLICMITLPFSVQAGQIKTVNGQGRWMSTECKAPIAPNTMTKASEIAANDLNADVTAHNVYAQEARTYMECLSKESGRDAKVMGKMIINEASKSMQEMSSKIQQAADALRKK